MKTDRIFIALFVMLPALLISGCPGYYIAPADNTDPLTELPAETDSEQLEIDAFDAVNDFREQNGLTRLAMREDIRLVARAHSADMAARDYFSHESPDGEGLADRLDNAAVPYAAAGENIAYAEGYDDPVPVVVQGWIDSPGHLANILDSNGDIAWEYTGMGVAQSGERLYFTQVFLLDSGKNGNQEEQWLVFSEPLPLVRN